MRKYIVVSCPTTELSYTNKVILNPTDEFAEFAHIAVRYPKKNEAFVFSVMSDRTIGSGQLAFNLSGRKWASLSTNSEIEAAPYKFEPKCQYLNTITFSTDFQVKNNAPVNMDFNTEDMAKQFSQQFTGQAFTVSQLFGFAYMCNNKRVVFELKVKDLQAINIEKSDIGTSSVEIGLTTANTVFMFERADNSEVKLIGGATGKMSAPQIFSTNLDFSSMGVGGLSEQFNKIFRRAFASRLLPPEFAQAVGETHVRGILLYGPPGTGKTLIARQIGKMLLAREPKVVNGPEVLNKYVGESEANIRKLFQEAEEEQAKSGIHSGLHVIIFDEIDAICKSRGNSASTSGVGDNVVNQLLSKIDGVNSLHNVLLIGMTNRMDLIDEALLRPGRLEVQIEIGLPNEEGRLEIFKIHTKKMMESGVLSPEVNLEELAAISKNYTGAEIAGLVGAARSYAISRVVKADSTVEITKEMLESIKVLREDFIRAMENDIKPALGASENRMKLLSKPIIDWDPIIQTIRSEMTVAIQKTLELVDEQTHSVLLVGNRGSGLTTLAATMATASEFPFIRVYLNEDTASKTESAAIQYMEKLFHDAERSELSCILLDNIDIILRYCHIGPRFSDTLRNLFNAKLQTELQGEHKRLIICTCSNEQAIKDLQIEEAFNCIIRVPSITKPEQVGVVLEHMERSGVPTFNANERRELVQALSSIPFKMGVKGLKNLGQGTNALGEPGQRVKTFIERMHKLNLVIRTSRLDQPFNF